MSDDRQHRAHPAQHHRSVDRGRRRALEHQDQASDAVRSRRCAQALALLVDKKSVENYIYGRTGVATAQLRQQPAERFVSKNTKWEFNIDKANEILDDGGWKKGADGIREKDGKKLKFVYQTSINAPRQKNQAIVKQACQKAGIEIEVKSVTASVFFSSDVANPDTYPHFYCDLQMYTTTMTQPDPEIVHAPVRLVGGRAPRRTSGRAATSRAGRTRSTTTPTRRRRPSSTRSSAPRCSSRSTTLSSTTTAVIPVVYRPRVHGAQAASWSRSSSGWDNDFWQICRTGTGRPERRSQPA